MVGLAIGDNGNHSFVISDAGEAEIRRFLRREGIRPSRPGFQYILPPPLAKFSTYRLSGDEHLEIRRLKLPRVTWGNLALFLLGKCSAGYLFHQGGK